LQGKTTIIVGAGRSPGTGMGNGGGALDIGH